MWPPVPVLRECPIYIFILFFCQLESLRFSSLKTPGPLWKCYWEINSLGKVFRRSTKQLLAHLCQILLTTGAVFPLSHPHPTPLPPCSWHMAGESAGLASCRLISGPAQTGKPEGIRWCHCWHIATKRSADSASLTADLKGSGEHWKVCWKAAPADGNNPSLRFSTSLPSSLSNQTVYKMWCIAFWTSGRLLLHTSCKPVTESLWSLCTSNHRHHRNEGASAAFPIQCNVGLGKRTEMPSHVRAHTCTHTEVIWGQSKNRSLKWSLFVKQLERILEAILCTSFLCLIFQAKLSEFV